MSSVSTCCRLPRSREASTRRTDERSTGSKKGVWSAVFRFRRWSPHQSSHADDGWCAPAASHPVSRIAQTASCGRGSSGIEIGGAVRLAVWTSDITVATYDREAKVDVLVCKFSAQRQFKASTILVCENNSATECSMALPRIFPTLQRANKKADLDWRVYMHATAASNAAA